MLQLLFDVHKTSGPVGRGSPGGRARARQERIVQDLVGPLDPSVQVDDDFLAADSQHSYTRDGRRFDSPNSAEAATLLAVVQG